ncbi:ABC transporter ATP-binding protein [Phocicoccus pinnipedialis]|uniref:Putative hemin import ATP-binding protein HrtA n=2 Tax=Phocicoccus pinnipedialis TaxID=110845 RepID=A0A6V7R583_9BACL|nr:ABC transporter ATP-binding protein [Jeotgalicoccus pinnipedialis]MBP1940010.1 hemin transport system ATP-binding protein [Jeotgalicoccus pinnipedialis]CAD2072042.1 Bacitracin export ATP-binding protein BceA [Jeotgalicoccus pinnipedialis]
MLELKNINKAFGKDDNRTEILEDVNLKVRRGELVVLYGPSGSGKSTLLSIIGALLEPSAGEIMMEDENWTHLSNSEMTMLRQKEIGFIFQQSHLLPYLKVIDQLVYVGTLADMKKKEAKRRAQNLLTTFGLEHRLNNYPKSLSGGEQQRVAIARAFMNHPSLILADEPTASLDFERAIQVVEKIQSTVREMNTMCIMITHDTRIFEYADRVYELKGGRLEAA